MLGVLVASFRTLPVGDYEALNLHLCNEHAARTMLWASIPDSLGLYSGCGGCPLEFDDDLSPLSLTGSPWRSWQEGRDG